MAVHKVFPQQYKTQLTLKIKQLGQDFSEFIHPNIEVYSSIPEHYRMRAEFKIWHEGEKAHYAMYKPGEYKKPFIIDDFPVGSKLISQLMPELLKAINASDILRKKLFQAEFLTTLSGESIITLIYHKPLDDNWSEQAINLKQNLKSNIIGRSRKQKIVLGSDTITEVLQVHGKNYTYQQKESSFTQPNAHICQKMLEWARDSSQELGGDLLELYCGNGNFTVPLSEHFNQVLATEVSKSSVQSAIHNLAVNNIHNTDIVRMSSEEFSQAIDKVRSFRRLKDINLDNYRFTTLLVDPPRAGLDDHTLKIAEQFENIIYVSCNPDTLKNNLKSLNLTHKISRFAAFDQFPYTPHMECGVLLQHR